MKNNELLIKFEKALEAGSFTGYPRELYEPIAYTMGQKGKRMRPLLLLMSCELFGGNSLDAIYPAMAIEVFHNFTLVHDDIMDKATLRRGKETVYQKWNESIAILSGDTMFALANKYMVKCGHDRL
ncbi:MAG: polyprenyl synthetase family protein, partial [Bacteroides sp.]|nr:polyprenyl synthetase family protein [Bacteroides sp.]